jgi:hypothetical protein
MFRPSFGGGVVVAIDSFGRKGNMAAPQFHIKNLI